MLASCRRGFDSHRPLQILKGLRDSLIFHIFQNYNFIANLGGKCSLNLLKWNFSGVSRGHRGRAMPHLLTLDCGVETGKFPLAIAPVTERMQSGLL
jgi:hypothetical protein